MHADRRIDGGTDMTKLIGAYKPVLHIEVLISLNFLYDFVDVASKGNVSDSYSREALFD